MEYFITVVMRLWKYGEQLVGQQDGLPQSPSLLCQRQPSIPHQAAPMEPGYSCSDSQNRSWHFNYRGARIFEKKIHLVSRLWLLLSGDRIRYRREPRHGTDKD